MRSRSYALALCASWLCACANGMDVSALGEGCPAHQKLCAARCVSAEDPRYGCSADTCAACPNPGAPCADGRCAPCDPHQKPCGDRCVDREDPAYGCAAVTCTPCQIENGQPKCAEGRCVAATCRGDFKVCGGQCVSTDQPAYGCAREGCAPCFLPDATAVCGADRQCALASCGGMPLQDCDEEPDNGCEVNTNEDKDNCGACGKICDPLPNAEVTCAGGECAVRLCSAGYGDCDRQGLTGCEVELAADSNHCGVCDHACAPGTTCVAGECRPLEPH